MELDESKYKQLSKIWYLFYYGVTFLRRCLIAGGMAIVFH